MRRACSSAVPAHIRSNQIEENRARKQSKIQFMSDSDSTDSGDSSSTVPLRLLHGELHALDQLATPEPKNSKLKLLGAPSYHKGVKKQRVTL